MKIFIIEDEELIRNELVTLLEKYGYICESSDDFKNIVAHVFKAEPALVLLDLNLPYQDGLEICREIRKKSELPVIMLTGQNTDMDELMSLTIGADDFIAKPYNAQILLARIQKVLKRTYETQSNQILIHKGLKVDLLKVNMSCNEMEAELTKNELSILRMLMVNKGNVVPRDAIIDELWQNESFIDDNTLNVNVVRLRKKLASLGLPDFLETKRGLGYKV